MAGVIKKWKYQIFHTKNKDIKWKHLEQADYMQNYKDL